MKIRSQGAFEYILLLGGILLIVVVSILILRNSVLNQANQQVVGNVNVWQRNVDARCYTENIIKNPGFEDGFANWAGIIGTDQVDSSVSYSGKNSGSKRYTMSCCNTYFVQDITVQPNTDYVFSAYIKTQTLGPASGFESDMGVGLWVSDASWTESPLVRTPGMIGTGTNGWTYKELKFNSGSFSSLSLRFAGYERYCGGGSCSYGTLGSQGITWYDDFCLLKAK